VLGHVLALLGEHFDIHGGGADLQFPHHENEIAQSEGAFGRPPMVNYWVHNGFVRVDNEKMSKSLGNFFTIRDVLKKYDAEVVRFFILRAHYRSPLNYSDAHLDDARGALTRLYTALDGVEGDGQPLDWQGEHAAASPKRWTMTSIRRWRWPRCSIWHRAEQVEIAALARPAESAGGVIGLLERTPQPSCRRRSARRRRGRCSDCEAIAACRGQEGPQFRRVRQDPRRTAGRKASSSKTSLTARPTGAAHNGHAKDNGAQARHGVPPYWERPIELMKRDRIMKS
jgi:hypothetical protein